jgi:polysaccharide export outer membrane protein
LNLRLLERVGLPASDGDLPVGPGDLIEVSVFEVEELSKLRLRIPAEGVISVPLIGQIQAAGRTATELEDEIRTRLRQKFMHNPQVAVFVHEHNSQRVTVMGAVRRGGVITLNRQLRLADALATAEGLADDADRIVYVVRRVPAGTLNQMGATAASVKGAATPPPQADHGTRAPTSSATAALAPVGSPAEVSAPAAPPATPPGAASPPPSDANTMEEVMLPIDLSELADGRDELNIPLRPGDVIYVPRAGSFYVGGSVERPGSFLLRSKTTVQQGIVGAGGVKNVADWTDVRLYRRAPSGQVEVSTVDLNAVEGGTPAPELRPNDVVIVGTHGGKAVFFGVLDVIKSAVGVAKTF